MSYFEDFMNEEEVARPKVKIQVKKTSNKTSKSNDLSYLTSDRIRTAYFLITDKSTRKSKSDIAKDLIEFLNENF